MRSSRSSAGLSRWRFFLLAVLALALVIVVDVVQSGEEHGNGRDSHVGHRADRRSPSGPGSRATLSPSTPTCGHGGDFSSCASPKQRQASPSFGPEFARSIRVVVTSPVLLAALGAVALGAASVGMFGALALGLGAVRARAPGLRHGGGASHRQEPYAMPWYRSGWRRRPPGGTISAAGGRVRWARRGRPSKCGPGPRRPGHAAAREALALLAYRDPPPRERCRRPTSRWSTRAGGPDGRAGGSPCRGRDRHAEASPGTR